MNNTINSLLIKAGANKKYLHESRITFEELGMIPVEKLFFLNMLEDSYNVKIDFNIENQINSPEDLLSLIH